MGTLNVSMYAAPGGAGRDPADTGKAHVELKLQFDTAEEAIERLKKWGVDITALVHKRP